MKDESTYMYKCLKCEEYFEKVACPDGFNFFCPKCGSDKSFLRKTLADNFLDRDIEWWELI